MRHIVAFVAVCLAVATASSIHAVHAGLREDVQFTPLDPNNTDPSEFWMPLWDTIPEEYCEYPRYPIVPTPGPMALNVLNHYIPNGTVPKVRAKPTNTWQKNLWGFQFNQTDQDHWNGVYPYPYIASPKDGNLFVMYPGSPVNDTLNRQIQVGFDTPGNTTWNASHPPIRNVSSPWMSMSLGFDIIITIADANATLNKVTRIGAVIDYKDNTGKVVATVYLSKGSPFINVECFGASVGFGNAKFPFVPPVIDVNNLPPGQDISGTDFTLTTAAGPAHPQGATWHAYFSSSVTLYLPGNPTLGINVTTPFTGLLQLGCGEVGDQAKSFLDDAKGVYVRDVKLTYDIDDSTNKLKMNFNFVKGGDATKTLTLLGLRHHKNILADGADVSDSAFWVVKGNMSAIKADNWTLNYNLTSAGFGDHASLDPKMLHALESAAVLDYDMRVDHCPGDNITWGYPGYMNMELYAYVRDLAQMIDIAIVLDVLGKADYALNMSKKVLECMQPVLAMPKEAPHRCPIKHNNITEVCVRSQVDLYFDQQFGGLVTTWYTRFAPHYCACDLPGGPTACIGKNYCDNLYGWGALSNYGNPFYNDHHFQYGYIIKSLAWLLYYQETKGAPIGMNATVIANITKQATIFAREIANPDDEKDPYFTFVRHKDVYDGHSWAEGYDYSGRFVSWNNQQSGGESINAYYAVYLLGLALNDTNIRDWGRVNLATEMVSLDQYQHLSNETADKKDQPTKIIDNWGKCISTLYGTGFSGNTYFGPNALFECAITWLPVTPITREWITPRWANETVHWLDWVINHTGYCVFYDPETMPSNPCPGPNGKDWTGNEWGCCPTNEGFPNNQWRTYPQWMPYLYVLESYYNLTSGWDKLQYTNYFQPTEYLPFPYLANRTANITSIVGYQSDITLTSALFHVATHNNK